MTDNESQHVGLGQHGREWIHELQCVEIERYSGVNEAK